MTDLFTNANRPTSQAAEKAIKGHVPELHRRILAQMQNGDMTPDQCAKALGETVLAIRPRFTELAALKKIEKTGERKKNTSGQKANVYRIKPEPR